MPPAHSQSAGHRLVTILIAEQLLFPECAVSCGLGRVFWTAMPETAVHKYCKAMLPKDKVWIAKQLEMATPADDVVLSKDLYERTFSRLIAQTTHA